MRKDRGAGEEGRVGEGVFFGPVLYGWRGYVSCKHWKVVWQVGDSVFSQLRKKTIGSFIVLPFYDEAIHLKTPDDTSTELSRAVVQLLCYHFCSESSCLDPTPYNEPVDVQYGDSEHFNT